uniref:Uncharacterized protein n=1 Tax=Bombyx mori TaxID=7091 RepID=A0A8R2M316_BOMMO|nr:uncharacterized protein LOC110384913 [Bombyx mori]
MSTPTAPSRTMLALILKATGWRENSLHLRLVNGAEGFQSKGPVGGFQRGEERVEYQVPQGGPGYRALYAAAGGLLLPALASPSHDHFPVPQTLPGTPISLRICISKEGLTLSNAPLISRKAQAVYEWL